MTDGGHGLGILTMILTPNASERLTDTQPPCHSEGRLGAPGKECEAEARPPTRMARPPVAQ